MSFSLRKVEAEGAKKAHFKHGVYALLDKGKLPSGRAWKREQKKISDLREAMIEQYGGKDIKPDVLALIESAIEGLLIQRLATVYVRKVGIMRRDSLKRGDLQLHSVLSGQFISYANLVRLNLEAAARLASQNHTGPTMMPLEIAAEIDAAKVASEGEPGTSQDAPGWSQERRTGDDEGEGAGGGES